MGAPIKTFKIGGISAAIFENQNESKGKKFISFSIKVEKKWYDEKESREKDRYKHTDNFKVNELKDLCLVAEEAYRYLKLKESEPKPEADADSVEQSY